jgi:uncharacterized protein YigA (DUF484 family)
MQPIEIVEWLRQNPEFFEEFADDLAQIYVPHSHRGQAVSLAERQLLTLRDKNRALELRLAELLQFGEENDITSDKLHRLTVDLMRATDPSGVVGTLEYHLRDRFGVPHVALRLWLPGVSGGLREFEPVGEEVVHLAQNLVSPYCGAYVAEEVLGWFSEAASSLNSFALFALRNGEETFGILAMASEDSERFYPDMGTLYLQRLSDLVSAALLRTVRDEPVLAATE